jgi:hypothetical protein
MNHREPPLSPADTHGKGLGLLLALLLALATTGSHAQTRFYSITLVVPQPEGIPYLQATGAPPLRFQGVEAPLHPAPSAPVPAATPAPAAMLPDPVAPVGIEPDPEPVAAPEVPSPTAEAKQPASVADPIGAPARTPAPILPDEARPTIRPEDFLPYFQVPGSARTPADVTLLVPAPKAPPAPGPLPPSSATYTQTPP